MALSFDEITSFLKVNGKKAAETAMDAANTAKLTAEIKAEEVKMLDVYKEIGKIFVEKAEGEVDEAYIPYLQKIADAKAKIEKLTEEKNALKKPAEAAEEAEEAAAEAAEAVEDAVEEAAEEVAEAVEEVKEAAAEAVEEVAEAAEEVVEAAAETAETVKEAAEDIFAE